MDILIFGNVFNWRGSLGLQAVPVSSAQPISSSGQCNPQDFPEGIFVSKLNECYRIAIRSLALDPIGQKRGDGLQQVEDGLQEGLQGLWLAHNAARQRTLTHNVDACGAHSWIAVHVSVQHHLGAAVPSCITMAGSVSVPFRPDVTSWEGARGPPPSPLGWSRSLARRGGSPPSLPWRGRRGVGRGGRGRRGRTGSSPVGKWAARPPRQTRLPSGLALPPPSRPETKRFNFFVLVLEEDFPEVGWGSWDWQYHYYDQYVCGMLKATSRTLSPKLRYLGG